MEPFSILAGLAGAGGSIGSALIGSNAQHDAQVQNYMISLMNYYQRQREQFDAKQEAQRIEHKQDQGYTDAQGNRTHFVPGQGWVVDASPQTLALKGREDNERMLSLGHDATIKRQQLDKNSQREIGEGDYANALMDQIRRQGRTNPDYLENSLRGAGQEGVNRAYDDTQAGVTKQALRSRSSNAGEMIKSIARQRSDALKDADMGARQTALTLAPQIDAQASKQNNDLYQMFASRASVMPDVSFSPSGVGESANANLAGAAAAGNSGLAMGFKAASMDGPRFPYQPANLGPANAVGAIGSTMGSMFQNMGQQQGYSSLIDEIRKSTRSNSGDFA